MENFEEILRKDLHQFLLSMKEVDERLPECPDVEDKWEEIAKAYIPDGIREFQDYPTFSKLCLPNKKPLPFRGGVGERLLLRHTASHSQRCSQCGEDTYQYLNHHLPF